jgi:hypothetical protein
MMRHAIAVAVLMPGCTDGLDTSTRADEVSVSPDHALVVGGNTVARDVADPRVAADGRIVFTQLPPGRDVAPDTVGKLVVLDLARGTRRIAVDDPHASSPFIVPGSDEVLYVSSRTGLASLYLARPGRSPRQLTNVGMRRVQPGFVPVPGRELEWQGRTAVFTARYSGVESRWSLDLDTGAVEALR